MPLPKDYVAGGQYPYWGLPATCKVHQSANIATNMLKAGENCRIDAFVTITGDVTLGNCVHIGVGAVILGGYGVTIGDGASVSPGAKIFTASEDVNADLTSNPQLPERAAVSGPVHVGRHSVIGAGSVILPCATIGRQTVIGALSLVLAGDYVPDGCVYGGIPIRFLKMRAPIVSGRKP